MDNFDAEQAIEDCYSALNAINCPFDPWQKEFIESVREQYYQKGRLSEKQLDVLSGLWDEV